MIKKKTRISGHPFLKGLGKQTYFQCIEETGKKNLDFIGACVNAMLTALSCTRGFPVQMVPLI